MSVAAVKICLFSVLVLVLFCFLSASLFKEMEVKRKREAVLLLDVMKRPLFGLACPKSGYIQHIVNFNQTSRPSKKNDFKHDQSVDWRIRYMQKKAILHFKSSRWQQPCSCIQKRLNTICGEIDFLRKTKYF